jgi:hypothetical protein
MIDRDSANRAAVKVVQTAYYLNPPLEKNRCAEFYKCWRRNGDILLSSVTTLYPVAYRKTTNRIASVWEDMLPWSYNSEGAMQFHEQGPAAGGLAVLKIEPPQSHKKISFK